VRGRKENNFSLLQKNKCSHGLFTNNTSKIKLNNIIVGVKQRIKDEASFRLEKNEAGLKLNK